MTDEQKQIENEEKHKKRQQKVKEKVDAKIAKATIEKGVFQVITGNGKANLLLDLVL